MAFNVFYGYQEERYEYKREVKFTASQPRAMDSVQNVILKRKIAQN